MADVMLALMRTFSSLRDRRVWHYVLAPALVSFVLWVALAFWALGALVDWLMAVPPMTWLVSWGVAWLAHALAYLGGWMVIFALAYLTTSLLAALLVLPLLLRHLAQRDYADVAPLGKDSFTAAAVNSLLATLIFVLGWVLTVPLWLIPGMSLLLPMALMAWFNRKTFAYDALVAHATEGEWQAINQRSKRPMLMLGMTMALLAHIPLVGLLVPTLAALAFIHFGMEGLRRLRGDDLMLGEAVRIND